MAATEKVGIEIELMNADEALKTLQRIDNTVQNLGRKKTMIKLDDGNLVSIDERIKQIKDRLAALDAAKKMGVITKEETAEAKRLSAELKVISRGLKDGTANARTFAQTFNSISSKVAHIGSAMQSLGNALTRLTSPFRRLTTGFVMGAGYKALNLFTEGISNAFGRADTMRNYERSLGALGLDVAKKFKLMEDEALSAKDNLDLAVQGLPTSLDEIMAAQKVYAGATGEMVSSTKTAIAANNAFLASTTDSRQQRVLQRYFVALASGANLTATQWSAMRRNMPLVFRKIGEAMGYTTKNELAEFEQKLGESDEMAQKFLKTFQKLGTTGVIRDAALVAVKSWSGLSSNIKIAFTRLGEGVIKTVNEVFEKATGRDLLSHLLGIDANGKEVGGGIKHWINDLSQSIQDWIRANPDELINFFNDLKAIDWKGLIRGMAEGMKWTADIIKSIAKIASDKDLSKLGRWAVKGNVFGWMFSTFGGLLKGLRHPLGFFGALAAKGIGKTGIFGKIASFFGKKKSLQEAGDVAATIPSVSGTFKRAFSSLEGLLKVAGGVLIASGTGFIASKSFKSILSDLEESIAIMSRINWEKGAGALTAMGTFIGAFMGLGRFAYSASGAASEILIGEFIVGAITTLALGFADVDFFLFERTMVHLENAIKSLNRSVDLMREIKSVPDGVMSNVSSAIGAMNQITELFAGKNGSPKDRGEVTEGLKGFSKTQADTVRNVQDALQAIIDSSAAINTINKIKLETDNVDTVKENFKTALEAIVDIFGDDLPLAFQGGEATTIATDVAGAFEQYKKTLGYLVGKDGIINLMTKIGSNLNSSVVIQRATGQITELMNSLKTAFASLLVNDGNDYASAATKMGNLASAVDAMHKAFQSLKKIQKIKLSTKGKDGTGDFKAIASIKTLIGQLEAAFDTDRINALNSQIGGFVDTVNGLLEQVQTINKDNGNITIEIHLKDKIIGDDTVINHINALNDKIKLAVNKIQLYYRRTITVDLNANVNGTNIRSGNRTPDSQSKHGGVQLSNGGVVYRAKGGGIGFPGRPRGTDTVPSWLTPGEFVHNRKAVNTFGIDFMRKVNNLDVRGAMNELMHRAGHMANVNRGSVVNNNYYNNNQRVTINNNGNTGAGFTFKSASRFVGAF